MNTFFVEITDTYGGEANYSWVKRLKVRAKSELGAIQKVARETGINWRKQYDTGDMSRYDSQTSCACCFVSLFDETTDGQYLNIKEV